MSSNKELKLLIPQLVAQHEHTTDIHLRVGGRIYFKSPKGFSAFDHVVSEDEIKEFFDTIAKLKCAEPNWLNRISGPTGDFNDSVTIGDAVRLRINGFYFDERQLLGATIRVNPLKPPPLEVLGVPELVKDYLRLSGGLILVTGPTSSGKTTTMASMIDYMNSLKDLPRHIITCEDPIEYIQEQKYCLVTQREVGSGYIRSMRDAVHSALRQSPNVVVIGEIRDRETCDAALHAALSGHLVIASLHTNGGKETIDTIMSYYGGNEREAKASSVASALKLILSQQLISRKDRTGWALATEVVLGSWPVRQAIKKMSPDEMTNHIEQSLGAHSGWRLNTNLEELMEGDMISREDAIRASYEPEPLMKKIGMVGI